MLFLCFFHRHDQWSVFVHAMICGLECCRCLFPAFVYCLIDGTSERREEEEEEETVQNRHIAGAEEKQEGAGVWAETRQGERRDVRARETAEDQ